MAKAYDYQRNRGEMKWVIAILVMAAIVAVLLVVMQTKKHPSPLDSDIKPSVTKTETIVDTPSTDDQEMEPPPLEELDEKTKKEVEIVMEKQRQAALAAIDAKPIEGVVTERPEFVSEIEWEVFQNVISQQAENQTSENQEPGSQISLTHLVSKLLFYKKLDAWEQMVADSSSDIEKRHALARELVDMLPAQLKDKAIDLKSAKQTEEKLLADLDNGN